MSLRPREQRILFELLKRLQFYREDYVRDKLKVAFGILKRSLPEFIIRRKNDKRSDVLITYVDGEGKSGSQYASMCAEENKVDHRCIASPVEFSTRYGEHVKKFGAPAALIIIDDIAATGTSLAANISCFIESNSEILNGVKIRVFTIAATIKGRTKMSKVISTIEHPDLDFHACETLDENYYAFPDGKQVWESAEQEDKAKSLCVDLGCKISSNEPLGFGNLGLLVAFPNTIPNNSLPILHSHGNGSSDWKPLFLRIDN